MITMPGAPAAPAIAPYEVGDKAMPPPPDPFPLPGLPATPPATPSPPAPYGDEAPSPPRA